MKKLKELFERMYDKVSFKIYRGKSAAPKETRWV
jgi:hypothetical protein